MEGIESGNGHTCDNLCCNSWLPSNQKSINNPSTLSPNGLDSYAGDATLISKIRKLWNSWNERMKFGDQAKNRDSHQWKWGDHQQIYDMTLLCNVPKMVWYRHFKMSQVERHFLAILIFRHTHTNALFWHILITFNQHDQGHCLVHPCLPVVSWLVNFR